MHAHSTLHMVTARPTEHAAIYAGDEVLLARLAAGDHAALGDLYDRYSPIAYGVALRLLHDPGQAEDVVQEAFLALWRQIAHFDDRRSSLRAWLLAIIHHRAVDLLRSARYRHETRQDSEMLVQLPAPISVEQVAMRREEVRVVQQALAVLPAEQRQAIELAYFGGCSYPEIARLMGVPLGTVKSRLRLGLNKLRSMTGRAISRAAVS